MREVFAEAPKKKKSRWKTATGITLVLVCLVAGVIYACGIFYFKDKFFTGTTINSIEASYDTVEEVEAIVASQVAKYRLLVKERAAARTRSRRRTSVISTRRRGRSKALRRIRKPINGR